MNIHISVALATLALSASAIASDQYIFGDSGANAGNKLTINGTIELPVLDGGWYSQGGIHNPAFRNYLAGLCDVTCASGGFGEYRNWYLFDIASLPTTITSATLTVYSYNVTLISGTYLLFDYLGTISSLVAGTGGTAAFADLGTGASFGSKSVQGAIDSNVFFNIPLSTAAISSINAAISGGATQWALGGSVAQIPEASTYSTVLFGLAALAVTGGLRRKSANCEA